jgi:hypothetical protein
LGIMAASGWRDGRSLAPVLRKTNRRNADAMARRAG